MKKLLSLLLALLMITSIALVACDETPDDGTESNDLAFNQQEPDTSDTSDSDSKESESEGASTPDDYTFDDVNETVYVQNCNKVNIRTSPSAANSDNIAGSLEFGDNKSYTRVKYNARWSGIEIDGEVYYINTYFLTTDPAEAVFTELSEPKTLYVNNMQEDEDGNKVEKSLNIRSYPNVSPDVDYDPDGNVAAVAKHGAELKAVAISKNEKCYRVEFTYKNSDDTSTTVTGYVWVGKYISETVPTGEAQTETAETEAALG